MLHASPDQRSTPVEARGHACRFCGASVTESVADLGATPPANRYLEPEDLERMEPWFPLHARVCGSCLLVQLDAFQSPSEIFGDYAYFSSFSEHWLEHCRQNAADLIDRFDLDESSLVVEVASNDGYLLQYFAGAGMPVLGIEPAANVADVARAKGIQTRTMFFGKRAAEALGAEGLSADLLIGNNVLAHVPDLNDFVAGLSALLRPAGALVMEFPHLLRLMEENQFDTIYHEHFSYFSAHTARRVFAAHGLEIFDIQTLSTHGGSLRVYAGHPGAHSIQAAVAAIYAAEDQAGLTDLGRYRQFAEQVRETKRKLLEFLIAEKRSGRMVAGYGAPAKGNTLLNYCGIGADFIDFTVDVSPHKQGRYLPGSRIPILSPAAISERQPDTVVILPWNWREEIAANLSALSDWTGRIIVPIPEPMDVG